MSFLLHSASTCNLQEAAQQQHPKFSLSSGKKPLLELSSLDVFSFSLMQLRRSLASIAEVVCSSHVVQHYWTLTTGTSCSVRYFQRSLNQSSLLVLYSKLLLLYFTVISTVISCCCCNFNFGFLPLVLIIYLVYMTCTYQMDRLVHSSNQINIV